MARLDAEEDDGDGLMVTLDRLLSVLMLVVELMRDPASFRVMVTRNPGGLRPHTRAQPATRLSSFGGRMGGGGGKDRALGERERSSHCSNRQRGRGDAADVGLSAEGWVGFDDGRRWRRQTAKEMALAWLSSVKLVMEAV